MASRSTPLIRRGINRLVDLLDRTSGHPALEALKAQARRAADTVNESWRTLQQAAVAGDRERSERETAAQHLKLRVQQWRPTLFAWVPAAAQNIRAIPSGGATVDDLIRCAEDMVQLFQTEQAVADIHQAALSDLTVAIEAAKLQNEDAVAALPAEAQARADYSDACDDANTVLVLGLQAVRATFGPTSHEYRQFISRDSAEQDEELELGEEQTTPEEVTPVTAEVEAA